MEATALSDLPLYWVLNKYGNNLLDRYRISRSENYINANMDSQNRRWDLGVQLRYSRLRIDDRMKFTFQSICWYRFIGYFLYRTVRCWTRSCAPSHLNRFPNLQSRFCQFPLIKNIETKSFLLPIRIQTDLVTTFYKSIDDSWYLYLQEDISFNWQIKTTTRQVISPESVLMVKSMF